MLMMTVMIMMSSQDFTTQFSILIHVVDVAVKADDAYSRIHGQNR